MKFPVSVGMIFTFLVLAIGQDVTPELKHTIVAPLNGARPVYLSALHIERGVEYPTVIKLTGKVEIKTPFCVPTGKNWEVTCAGEMIVRADEAEFHEDTGQIEAHGNVVATPLQQYRK